MHRQRTGRLPARTKQQDGRAKAYLRDLCARVDRFAEDFGERNLATIESQEVDDWLRSLDVAPKSRNNFRATVSVMFSYGVDRGFIDSNPVETSGKATLVDKAPEIFTVEELSRPLAHAEASTRPALAIGAFAGLRPDEVRRLHWSAVNPLAGIHRSAGAELEDPAAALGEDSLVPKLRLGTSRRASFAFVHLHRIRAGLISRRATMDKRTVAG